MSDWLLTQINRNEHSKWLAPVKETGFAKIWMCTHCYFTREYELRDACSCGYCESELLFVCNVCDTEHANKQQATDCCSKVMVLPTCPCCLTAWANYTEAVNCCLPTLLSKSQRERVYNLVKTGSTWGEAVETATRDNYPQKPN